MMDDILTMIWKEWKDLLLPSSRSRRETGVTIVVLLAILGLVFRAGPMMMSTPQALWAPSVLVFLLMMAMVADSFAGERERHTLETLLASRLSDLSILIGKIGGAVIAGWGLIVLLTILGFVGNLAHGDSGAPISWKNVILGLFFTLLLSMLSCCFGVLVSLRAATARQATQTFGIGITVAVFAVTIGIRKLPVSWQASLMHSLAPDRIAHTEAIAAFVLIALNVFLFAAARLRFQRSRLSLD